MTRSFSPGLCIKVLIAVASISVANLAFAGVSALAEDVGHTDWLLVETSLNGQLLPDFQDAARLPNGELFLSVEPLIRAAEGRFEFSPHEIIQIGLGVGSSNVEIDIAEKKLLIDGEVRDWRQGDIDYRDGQLFMGERTLSDLFGLSVTFNEGAMRVDVRSARPLPADARRLRERRWERFGRGGMETDVYYTNLYTPYKLWGTPRGNVGVSTNSGEGTSGASSTVAGEINVEAGFLTNQIFVAGNDQDGVSNLRWTGRRFSPEGEAFGIPGLYSAEIGDISPLRLPLLDSIQRGRGVSFSTTPTSRPDLFDVTRIEGDALPGWDAELYRGNELIDFLVVGDDGRYNFDDVTLGFGANDFRVMLYGPQGEVEEREVSQIIPDGQMLPGEIHLRGSFLQSGQSVFGRTNNEQSTGEQIAVRADFGLSSRLSAGLILSANHSSSSEFSQLYPGAPERAGETQDSSDHNIGLILSPALSRLRSEFVLVHQSHGANAANVGFGFTVADTAITGNYKFYEKSFVSDERFIGGEPISSRLELGARGQLGQLGSFSIGSLGFTYRRDQLSKGSIREEYDLIWRNKWGAMDFSQNINRFQRQGVKRTNYRLLGSYRRGAMRSRIQVESLGKEFDDLFDNTNFSGSMDYRFKNGSTLSGSFRYSLNAGAYAASLRFSDELPIGRLSASVSSTDQGQWAAGLSLTFGLGIEGESRISLMRPEHSYLGAVAITAFEDQAIDGEFEPDEDRALENVSFLVDGRPFPAATDEHGRVLIPSLPVDRPVSVAVDRGTLDDPFLTASRSRFQLQARPGVTHQVDLSFLDSAVVAGKVELSDQPAAGVQVVARKLDGMAVETTRSLKDGYFIFDSLSHGNWQFAVLEETVPSGLESTAPVLSLDPGSVHDGLEIDIFRAVDGQHTVDEN
ncbi:hypothetical protein [Pseudohaliea rubra]|uniref:P pilus assembly protein, porin PapC n=1 Tax=Pseudohaliea rubra DSM 19751 TaxID=1265313 RepID=A0A095VW18_9GAMM|nr:hypothetical protein [Pseudohaliea rubra]KGE05243.1 hypothetical protein HRUBRA_00188 [Pseudohaliea rubra DSM 19751]